MTEDHECCGNCKHRKAKVAGVVECSFAPDGYVDRIIHECHRYPPQRNFWGTTWPYVHLDNSCSEFSA